MSNCYYRNDSMEFEYNDVVYRVDVDARGTYSYDPGCMYMKNGDPGYPPESSFDIDDIDAVWYIEKEDGSEEEIEPTESMKNALWGELEDHNEWFEPEEPDYD